MTPQTGAHQVPPSMEFSRQEYWSGLPFPSPGDLPNPGIEPKSPALETDALSSEPPGKPYGSPESKFCWPSEPNVLGVCISSPEPHGWRLQSGTQTLGFLGRTSSIVIILLLVGCPFKGIGLDYVVTLPLLSVSLWFLLYIFSYTRSFLVGSSLFHQ